MKMIKEIKHILGYYIRHFYLWHNRKKFLIGGLVFIVMLVERMFLSIVGIILC